MRTFSFAVVILMFALVFTAVSTAADQLGIADRYKISFSEPMRVADSLLPKGNYEIRHEMEGNEHVMVFHQLGSKKPVEVRAKCRLVPLETKAVEEQRIYVLNGANERVLQELVFKGDRSKHVF